MSTLRFFFCKNSPGLLIEFLKMAITNCPNKGTNPGTKKENSKKNNERKTIIPFHEQ